jgi:hypothetical protein
VVASFRRVRGTSAIAGSRIAFRCCTAGRQTDASVVCGSKWRSSSNTPRRNVSGVLGGGSRNARRYARIRPRRQPRGTRQPRARGHAAQRFRMIFAIVRAAMDRSQDGVAARLSTAARAAVGPNAGCRTVNASSRLASEKPPCAGSPLAAKQPHQPANRRTIARRRDAVSRSPGAPQSASAALGSERLRPYLLAT